MKNELLLRDVVGDDLPIFFEQQLNQEANTIGFHLEFGSSASIGEPSTGLRSGVQWHELL